MITFSHSIKSVVAILFAITFFSCEGNYKNVKKLSLKDNEPLGIGKDVNFKYTDSGKVVANVITPLFLDFSNLKFPYKEFPKGVEVHFWDKKDQKSTVTSNYAIQYENTGIVDLRDSVVLVTHDSLVLRADQLYWDQKNKWVFTNQPYQIEFKDGSYNDGAWFDSSQDFTTFLSRKNEGVQLIDTKKEENNAQDNI
ncbi:LPS export ABC transporter periplasmic protein LptC [Marixanthomonas spongiae]|uniref:LPS export ABC transporter periplasmic protein LptC n=1 Tax=Marixanthomonas spongiae TaxID=2174845 RepID=A0A2U0I8E8_9FLAO|nr:LPS export ABC transporter periplasmic protein LptC [Marixanthomonas spongiae]PVW17320.1 LPS export ABC transporter periplasmic protein LptC [Marixanthomonas spongiae]